MSAPTAGPSTSTSVSASAPSTKSKKREKKAQASAQPAERLKVIVRRLPADLPEEIFWRSVERWVSDDAVSWKMFYPGKARKRCVHSV
jgi:regulator of nonsense transcripts 3